MRHRWAFIAVAFALVACGSDDDSGKAADPGPLAIPEGCNPLAADWDCLLPYPSDILLTEDASLPSGRRVTLGASNASGHDERSGRLDDAPRR